MCSSKGTEEQSPTPRSNRFGEVAVEPFHVATGSAVAVLIAITAIFSQEIREGLLVVIALLAAGALVWGGVKVVEYVDGYKARLHEASREEAS